MEFAMDRREGNQRIDVLPPRELEVALSQLGWDPGQTAGRIDLLFSRGVLRESAKTLQVRGIPGGTNQRRTEAIRGNNVDVALEIFAEPETPMIPRSELEVRNDR